MFRRFPRGGGPGEPGGTRAMGVCEPGQGGNAAAISNTFMCLGEPPRLSRPPATQGSRRRRRESTLANAARLLSNSPCSGTRSAPRGPRTRVEKAVEHQGYVPPRRSPRRRPSWPPVEPTPAADGRGRLRLPRCHRPASPANYTVVARRYRPAAVRGRRRPGSRGPGLAERDPAEPAGPGLPVLRDPRASARPRWPGSSPSASTA